VLHGYLMAGRVVFPGYLERALFALVHDDDNGYERLRWHAVTAVDLRPGLPVTDNVFFYKMEGLQVDNQHHAKASLGYERTGFRRYGRAENAPLEGFQGTRPQFTPRLASKGAALDNSRFQRAENYLRMIAESFPGFL
jgi:hypothetical protein